MSARTGKIPVENAGEALSEAMIVARLFCIDGRDNSGMAMTNSQGVVRLWCRNTLEYRSGSGAELGPIDVFNQAFFVADVLD